MRFKKILFSACIMILSFVFINAEGNWKKIIECKVKFSASVSGFSDEKTGYTGGEQGVTYYTKDGGKTWTQSEAVPALCRNHIDIVDKNTVLTAGLSGLVISTDGGVKWEKIYYVSWKIVSFVNENTGWAADELGKISITEDKGANWTDINVPAGVRDITAINAISKNSGYVIDIKGNMYYTEDAGINWTKQTIAVKDQKFFFGRETTSIRFNNKNEGIVILRCDNDNDQWAVLKTTDAGKSWSVKIIKEKIACISLSKDMKYLTFCRITSPVQIAVYKNN